MSVSLWHGEGHGGPCHEGDLRHDKAPVGPRHLGTEDDLLALLVTGGDI